MRLSDKISGSLSSKYDNAILAALNESCTEKQDLKEEEIEPKVEWDNYEDYSEEEIEKINNLLDNANLEAIKHEGNKEEGYSVAVKDNNSGLIFWMDYLKDGQDIYGDWNQYIFHTNDSRDRIKQAMQSAYTDDWSFFMDVEDVGIQYLRDKGLISDSEEGMIFESCKTELNEDIKDETAQAAKYIALEIQERGIMNFEEIDEMAADQLGITVEELRDKQLDTDIYISLNYEGIDNNMSTGDFYTQEYAEEHPEVLEESEKVDEDTEEYLEPRYNGRKSFYKKAKVVTKDNGDEELYSYGTHVGGVRGGKPYSKGKFSQTTSRHQKEYFAQRGYDHNKVDIEESEKQTLNETDATPEFLEDLKNLINNHMRVDKIESITIETKEYGDEFAVIKFENGAVKRKDITGDSNLAAARTILFELA